MRLIFEWDDEKAQKNHRKHRVGFEEAKTIFSDPLLISFPDEYHSGDEQRVISVGASSKNRILLLVHTEMSESGNTVLIRIISARQATASERRIYEEN
ncbi:MAG: BrnT family toxin [Pyrinomonadaceae bacterium]